MMSERQLSRIAGRLAGAGLLLVLVGCVQSPTTPSRPQAVVSSEPPPLLLRPDRPQRYQIGFDDNVWDISARYLDDPWRWGELWPGGDWPSLYPGDVIELDEGNGQLQLADGERPTVKLTPQVRVEVLTQQVPTLTRDAVLSFYDNSVVLSDTGWRSAPYIIGGTDGRVLLAGGHAVYARGAAFDQASYGVYRPEDEFRHPDTGDFLGFNMVFLGEAVLEDVGDPATLRLVSARREVRSADRLLEAVDDPPIFDFTTVPAPPDSYGRILGVLGKSPSLIGRYDTVVVTLGEVDGMRRGSVLATYATDPGMSDPITGATIDAPRERSGLVVLYRVFDRVSYGLVTESRREIRPNDVVREPS